MVPNVLAALLVTLLLSVLQSLVRGRYVKLVANVDGL